MPILYTLSEFIDVEDVVSDCLPDYWYEGRCSQSGKLFRLPRTPLIEKIARGLMKSLSSDGNYAREGKMYGVLLVKTPSGKEGVLKAFSGLLWGSSRVEGWMPPIPGRERVTLEEAHTLGVLEAIKQELMSLQQIPERQQYKTLCQEFETSWQELSLRHRQSKQERQIQRQLCLARLRGNDLDAAMGSFDEESRREGIERRNYKRQRDEVLQPLKQCIERADKRIQVLKQQRKEVSRKLQAQMYAAYSLTNFSGQSLSLQQLMSGGFLPTGAGDCCAPKLLHYAATEGLIPLAMAEFWWGSASVNEDKIQGEFYPACESRCQPLMGFLLSGIPSLFIPPNPPWKGGDLRLSFPWKEGDLRLSFPLKGGDLKEGNCDLKVSIIYEDEWLIAVNKPSGLLSVPGRYGDRQDSVLNRLRLILPDGMALIPVHRLDRETSGILLLAKDKQTHRHLSQQFEQRQVYKVYDAILAGTIVQEEGVIELPLWGDPSDRPYQKVDWQRGKPSVTRFRVMAREGDKTHIEFIPLTGRTHQIRVHAADKQGLGVPILGDRLYGFHTEVSRLHLHARELKFQHPQLGNTLHLRLLKC